jgi:glycosyltransferase involved in cell wall biosynthesis
LGQARQDFVEVTKVLAVAQQQSADSSAELARLQANLARRSQSFSYKILYIPREIGRKVRKPFARLAFHKSGKPRGWVRKALFHSNGRVRGVFRHWVYDANGEGRRAFKNWLLESGHKSPLALPPAALATLLTVAPEESTLAAVEASVGAILVAADFPPLYDQHSGGLRLKALIQMIGKLQRPIIFASSCERSCLPGVLGSDKGRTHYEDVLKKAGVVEFTYGVEELDSFLGGQSLDFRFVFLSFPAVAETFLPIVRRHCPEAKVIYDMVDFHALRMEREAALKGDAKLAEDAAAMKRCEIALAKAADITIAISADEKKALLELAPTAVIEILPNIFEIPAKAPPGPEGRRDVLFLGGFWHTPNGDAAKWFIERIWPRVSAAAPDAHFLIAGSNPGEDILALGQIKGVEVLGYVADLKPLYDAARVCVAPLRFGAGVKGKVGQSMAYGLPVVATSIGAEGMRLPNGEHLLVADDPEAFAEHVINLLRDDALWTRTQAQARNYVEMQFSVAAVTERVETLFHA